LRKKRKAGGRKRGDTVPKRKCLKAMDWFKSRQSRKENTAEDRVGEISPTGRGGKAGAEAGIGLW